MLDDHRSTVGVSPEKNWMSTMPRKKKQTPAASPMTASDRARAGLVSVAWYTARSYGATANSIAMLVEAGAPEEVRDFGKHVLRSSGNIELAERAFRSVGSEIPPELLLEAARLHQQRGSYAVAIPCLARAEAFDELFALGAERLAAKDLVSACYAFAASKRPAPIDSLLELFAAYIESSEDIYAEYTEKHDPDNALPVLRQLVTFKQLVAFAHHARTHGNTVVAVWICAKLLERNEDEAESLVECLGAIAEAFYDADDTEGADEVRKAAGKHVVPISTRARAAYINRLLAREQNIAAQDEYEKIASALDNAVFRATAHDIDPELHVAIGTLNMRRGYFARGLAAFRRAQHLIPPDLLTEAYAAIIERKDAQEIREVLVMKDVFRPSPDTLALFGQTLLDVGCVLDAMYVFASINDPLSPDALIASGDALLQQGMAFEAQQAYRAALAAASA